MIIKPFAKLNRRIRRLNKELKHWRNAKKAYQAEAAYYQAIIDEIQNTKW